MSSNGRQRLNKVKIKESVYICKVILDILFSFFLRNGISTCKLNGFALFGSESGASCIDVRDLSIDHTVL